MATVLDADSSGWRFAQCFGDKGEVRPADRPVCPVRADADFCIRMMVILSTGRNSHSAPSISALSCVVSAVLDDK